MTLTHISVSDNFSRTPGGRFREDGPFSGVEFREEIVQPSIVAAIRSNKKVVIDLDGVAGYATSFLEEAFGGLVRALRRPIRAYLQIVTSQPLRLREVESYISDAEKRL